MSVIRRWNGKVFFLPLADSYRICLSGQFDFYGVGRIHAA